jgi:hypothetical protein
MSRGRVVQRKKAAMATYMRVRQKALFLFAALLTSSVSAIVAYLLLFENHIHKKQAHEDGKEQQDKPDSRSPSELEIAERNIIEIKGKDLGGVRRSSLR